MGIGIGIGGVVLPVMAQYFIQHYGWRAAYVILGFMCLLIAAPLILFFFKNKPEDVGLTSDGLWGVDRVIIKPSITIGLYQVFRTRTFRILFLIFFLVAACGLGTLIHLQQMLTDRGITQVNAAFAASLLGATSIIGRIVNGILLDKYFAPYVAAASFLGAVLGLVILWTGTNGSFIYLGVGLIGFALGAEADIMPYLLSRYFGVNNLATLCGMAFGAHTLGGAIGPYLFGHLFDISGSYRIPLLYASGSMMIAVILTFFLKKYSNSNIAYVEEYL
ncbi:MAG: hypothetical protein NVS1B13_15300 [Flavisolibacter sp.]